MLLPRIVRVHVVTRDCELEECCRIGRIYVTGVELQDESNVSVGDGAPNINNRITPVVGKQMVTLILTWRFIQITQEFTLV